MENTTENSEKQGNTPTKQKRQVNIPKRHKTLVRPRFNEVTEVWYIKLIDELGVTKFTVSHESFETIERIYFRYLMSYK